MLIVELLPVFDAHLNLALEEYLLRDVVKDEPILLFYVNDPSVVVGRNQNVFEEIDLAYARDSNIPVLRRLSGGGTVYHDRGNLNYSLITSGQELLNNFGAFTRPVISALAEMGIPAELRNRSSIFVDDCKISGNAQYATSGKLVSHGTLLFDADLSMLRRALTTRDVVIESRSVQSVRSSVRNLRELLHKDITLSDLGESLRHHFVGSWGTAVDYEITNKTWQRINDLAITRYRDWSWNIGRSPNFTLTRRTATKHGEMVVVVTVENGLIREISSHAEVIHQLPWSDIVDRLRGVRYDPDDLHTALSQFNGDARHALGEGIRLLDLFY